MLHTMGLRPAPMQMMRSGRKTIELRLYDKKRQRISIGDIIEFTNTENSKDILRVEVTELLVFDSFDELYRELPLLECGYTETNIDSASALDMEQYYSKEQQKQYGVVGIRIAIYRGPDDMTENDIKNAHTYSSGNKEQLSKSKKCGCFYCLKIFDPKLIINWCDDGQTATAICPFCGIDSIIYDNKIYPVSGELLEQMNQYWF